jgi:hypothetical protein
VYLCMKSLLVNQSAFLAMKQDGIKASVLAILRDNSFWVQLQSLTELLEPFSAVITAVQGEATTMADVYLYWLFLARKISLDSPGLDQGLQN